MNERHSTVVVAVGVSTLSKEELEALLQAKRQENHKKGIFWMLTVDGAQGSVVRHYLEEDALREAERLTRKLSKSVTVLKSVKSVEMEQPPIIVREL